MMLKRLFVLAFLFSFSSFLNGCATDEAGDKAPSPAVTSPEKANADKQSTEKPSAEKPSEAAKKDAAPSPAPEVVQPSPTEVSKQETVEQAKPLAAPAAASQDFTGELEKVYFDFDKSDIKPEFREMLAKDAEKIKQNPGTMVVIEGHCDERGTAEYNLALGERRAMAVKKYLSSLGIQEDGLYTISFGEEKPAVSGHNEAAWSKNRRVQFSRE